MAPSAISEVRGFLSTVDMPTCLLAADATLNAASAEEAESVAKSILGA